MTVPKSPPPTERPWDLDLLRSALTGPVCEALPHAVEPRLTYLCPPKAVADDATKLIVTDRDSTPQGVVLVASPTGDDLVRRGHSRAVQIQERLGQPLGAVVLLPLHTGTVQDRTFAIYPYCKPMSRSRLGKRAHRILLRPTVLHWLRDITRSAANEADSEQLQSAFVDPLQHLARHGLLSSTIRSAADEGIKRAQAGQWTPRLVPMHGDLWDGNILFAHDRAGRRDPFARISLIDWPSGLPDGYAIYDIVRLSRSMHIPRRFMRREICRHCEHLRCEPRDARSYLLAAFGHLSQHLGEFPPERFARLAEQCDALVTDAVA